MKGIAREDLLSLMQSSGKPAVSIYMPTHKTGRELQQDPIRLKNLLDDVHDQLKARGWNNEEINRFLDPALGMFSDSRFWQHLSSGLAILLSNDVFRVYRLPLSFDSFVRVADHFYLKPLLPLLTGDGHFYVLTLSQGKVSLLEGTRESLDEIDVEGMPDSLRKVLAGEEHEEHIQWQTGTAPAPGGEERRAMYHGQNSGEQRKKNEILRFFQQVDAGIQDYLKDRTAPLILVGVEYLLPIYREANGYPHLASDGIAAQPESLTLNEIHDRVWKLIRPFFQRSREEASNQYQILAGRGDEHATNDIMEIVPAAYDGRVDTVFVDTDESEWGRFDPTSRAVERLPEDDPAAQDLLDFAALHTLLNDGTVFAVQSNHMPGDAPAAAVLRY